MRDKLLNNMLALLIIGAGVMFAINHLFRRDA